MDERKRVQAINGLATFFHLLNSQIEAHESGRITVFGHGRLTTQRPDNTVQITGAEIRSLDESDTENNE